TQVPVLQHKAVFEDFVYQGNDEFYNQHPLQSDDEFYNPILPGWYSDPSICADDKGNYFMVTSTFGYYPGVPLFHSTDMLNWRQVGHILTRPEQLPLEGALVSTGGIFAASIFYNKYNDTYYMITTNMNRMMRGQNGNFIVKSKNPLSGEWSDPICGWTI
ncbi:MAG: family 43 glycosylhydrolase, partial [Bacteroidaceae bacterium]|nr:family 43 glycosylhydrolase [Bacteroidaceae bacterium]